MWFTEHPVVKRKIQASVTLGKPVRASKTKPRSEAGYTFVEVLIALVIASIILIPLYRSLDNYLSEGLIPSLKDSPQHRIELILAEGESGGLPPSSLLHGATVQSILINGERVLKISFKNSAMPLYLISPPDTHMTHH